MKPTYAYVVIDGKKVRLKVDVKRTQRDRKILAKRMKKHG